MTRIREEEEVVGRKPVMSCSTVKSLRPVQCTAENWTQLNTSGLNDPVLFRSSVQFYAVQWPLHSAVLGGGRNPVYMVDPHRSQMKFFIDYCLPYFFTGHISLIPNWRH